MENNINIVVAEDEANSAKIIQRNLENHHYNVSAVVSTAAEAIMRTAQEKPDLVLMDINLEGEMDGVDAAREIRSQFNTPIIYITGSADDKILERAKSTDPVGFLLKPVHGEELHATIQIALHKSKDHKNREPFVDEMIRFSKITSMRQFSGGIAHDLNNILTAIMGCISLAEFYNTRDDELNAIIQDTKAAAHQAKDLTERLMDFSGGRPPKFSTDLVNNVMEKIVGEIMSSPNYNCLCELVKTKSQSLINIDTEQFGRVVKAIISNADQSMSDGGIIRIYVKEISINQANNLPVKDGVYIQITIKDHGVGISLAQHSKVFDPYYSSKDRCNGFTLATAYTILRNHGGHLTFDSKKNIGSNFHLYLPKVLSTDA